jgi:hypothetical protein
MRTIKELDELVGYRIKQTEERNPQHNGIHRMDFLFPGKTELEGFSTMQLLLIIRKYDMLLPYCSECSAVQPNGKWLPREGMVEVLTNKYTQLTHGYCLDCLDKKGVPPEEC